MSFIARLLGFECHIFVPAGMVGARIFAMEQEGAPVTPYLGYETIPGQVVEGYSTIFSEVDAVLDASRLERTDLVVAPMGVGAFMPAAATHHRSGEYRPVIDGVEPIDANDVQVSALEGDITHVAWPHRSIMVGLNCGRLSPPQRSP
ncbi:MAG: diaminopropionate ammonia-lyase [Ilumatobacter sp.]